METEETVTTEAMSLGASFIGWFSRSPFVSKWVPFMLLSRPHPNGLKIRPIAIVILPSGRVLGDGKPKKMDGKRDMGEGAGSAREGQNRREL